MMSDETQQVLDMVASGKITPEQAEDLLDALKEDAPRPAPEVSYQAPRPRNRRQHAKKSLRPTVAALAEAATFGVDAEFVRSIEQAGYRNLTLDELVTLAKFGADGEFVRSLAAVGYTNLGVDELEELAKFGVDGEFVQTMRTAGLTDLSVEELVELGRSGADADSIAVLRSLGHLDLATDQPVPSPEEGEVAAVEEAR